MELVSFRPHARPAPRIGQAQPVACRNALFARLGGPQLRQITAESAVVPWKANAVILDLMDPVHHVWFPETAVATMIVPLEQGETSQAGTIGRCGVVGFEALLGGRRALCRYVVEIPGTARRVPVRAAMRAFEADAGFRSAVLGFAVALHSHSMQAAACHGLHHGCARLACHLLLLQDCLQEPAVMPLTQEVMAGVLGLQRTTVTAAARSLRRRGLIEYRRGKISILDRAGLEEASCECYGTIRANYDRLSPLGEALSSRDLS